MRIIINILILISLAILYSCQSNKVEKIEIIGKWKGYNISENEYFECDIDKDTIGCFTHYSGNGGLREYKILKDTLFFRGEQFILKVISENQFSITNRGDTDTLTRLPDSVTTYHTITNRNDSIFNLFYKQFERRAYDSWIKYGYVTEEKLKESIINEGEIKEEIIMINEK
jgi:hypothetical protein